jgi:hypothetical protein
LSWFIIHNKPSRPKKWEKRSNKRIS